MATTARTTGTYELTVKSHEDGTVGFFVRPLGADEPILAVANYHWRQVWGTESNVAPGAVYQLGDGYIAPEDIEATIGPRMGLLVLLSLYSAAEAEFTADHTNRALFDLMERTHDVTMILREKNKMNGI